MPDEGTYDPRNDINYEELQRFLSIIFEPEDWVEFRAIRPSQQRGTQSCYIDVGRFVNDCPPPIRQWLDAHHTDRYLGLYVGANPRTDRRTYGPNRSSSTDDVKTFRCAFADLDNCDPNSALALINAQRLPLPTLIVHSGRSTGTHLYWRFDQEMDQETWEGVQRAIQKRLNGDAMKDPPRVMRVPGSYNFKRNNNARILKHKTNYPTYESLGLSVDEMLPPTFITSTADIEPDERNLNWTARQYLESSGIPEGGDDIFDGRNVALFSAACDFIANGFDFDETCARLMPLAVDRDGLPEYEAKRTIANAVNRNPSRTLQVNTTGVDETWTRYMERPQYAGRAIPHDQPAENFDEIGNMNRQVRPASEEEQVRFAMLRGDIDLPTIIDDEDTTAEEPEIEDETQRDEIDHDEAERLRYEAEMAEIQQYELSAPALMGNYEPHVIQPEGRGKKPQHVKKYVSPNQIIEDVRDGFNGWPKYAPGMGLFGYRPAGDLGDEIVHGLPTPASFFGFMKIVGQVRWTNEPCIYTQTGVERELRPLKEAEAFELMKERCPNRYAGFAQLPHTPAIDQFYYPKYDLPEPSKNLEVLMQFINALNPETETDRMLLLAALLTPGWGGPAGARPLFVLSSDHGQGSGKTETVKAMSEIWGGMYPLALTKSWSDNAKMMMSSTDWLTRVCVWDNVKGRFSSAEIEGAVTGGTIQGHRMYVGTVKRFNDVTFFLTFNNPEMSRDLAQRSIVIKLGKPKAGDFINWWQDFINDNKRQLIADCLSILARPAQAYSFSQHSDRWRAWQTGVLARLPDIDIAKAMNLIESRREEVDSDTDEGEQIARAIYAHASGRDLDLESDQVILSQIEIKAVVQSAGLWRDDASKTPAANSRLFGQFVRNKSSALGLLRRDARKYCMVNDRGEAVNIASERIGDGSSTSRSPRWIFNAKRAREIIGSEMGRIQYGGSQSPSDNDPGDIPPV